MRKTSKESDDLRPEYDLRNLRIVERGPARKGGKTVALESDVAKAFPTAKAVNDALRSLMRAKKRGISPGS